MGAKHASAGHDDSADHPHALQDPGHHPGTSHDLGHHPPSWSRGGVEDEETEFTYVDVTVPQPSGRRRPLTYAVRPLDSVEVSAAMRSPVRDLHLLVFPQTVLTEMMRDKDSHFTFHIEPEPFVVTSGRIAEEAEENPELRRFLKLPFREAVRRIQILRTDGKDVTLRKLVNGRWMNIRATVYPDSTVGVWCVLTTCAVVPFTVTPWCTGRCNERSKVHGGKLH